MKLKKHRGSIVLFLAMVASASLGWLIAEGIFGGYARHVAEAKAQPELRPAILDKEGRRLKTKHWWRVTYFPPRGFDAKVWITETRPMHVNGWVRFRIPVKGDPAGGTVNVFRPLIEPVPVGTKLPPKRFVPTSAPRPGNKTMIDRPLPPVGNPPP